MHAASNEDSTFIVPEVLRGAPAAHHVASSFSTFRSTVARQTVTTTCESNTVTWHFYDYGSSKAKSSFGMGVGTTNRSSVENVAANAIPLLCLPPINDSAVGYYELFLRLCPRGYRLISVELPTELQNLDDLVRHLDKLISSSLNIPSCHILGVNLGGYLAQCLYLNAFSLPMNLDVKSIILCNTWSDPLPSRQLSRRTYPFFPKPLLRKVVMNTAHVDWISGDLKQKMLVQRMELAMKDCPEPLMALGSLAMEGDSNENVDDSEDASTIPSITYIVTANSDADLHREDVLKRYPDVVEAHMRSPHVDSNPYCGASAEEFCLLVEVHLRRWSNSHSA